VELLDPDTEPLELFIAVVVKTEVCVVSGLPETLGEAEAVPVKLWPLKDAPGEFVLLGVWLAETEEDPLEVWKTE